jgi:hypothetical protein
VCGQGLPKHSGYRGFSMWLGSVRCRSVLDRGCVSGGTRTQRPAIVRLRSCRKRRNIYDKLAHGTNCSSSSSDHCKSSSSAHWPMPTKSLRSAPPLPYTLPWRPAHGEVGSADASEATVSTDISDVSLHRVGVGAGHRCIRTDRSFDPSQSRRSGTQHHGFIKRS